LESNQEKYREGEYLRYGCPKLDLSSDEIETESMFCMWFRGKKTIENLNLSRHAPSHYCQDLNLSGLVEGYGHTASFGR
jgi:hypothetical protein